MVYRHGSGHQSGKWRMVQKESHLFHLALKNGTGKEGGHLGPQTTIENTFQKLIGESQLSSHR